MRLENKVALITGGTSGIGEATAILFAKEGAKIAITGRNEKRGHAVTAQILKAGGQAIFLRTDVRKAAECRRAVEETVSCLRAPRHPLQQRRRFLSAHHARLQRGRMGPAN